MTGTVETIAMRPRPHFSLRDRLSDRLVKVYADDDVMQQILQAFGRTVTVGGRVRRRSDGIALDMREVRDVRVLPTKDELPSLESLRGSIPDMIGGRSVEEYMDDIRGRNEQ